MFMENEAGENVLDWTDRLSVAVVTMTCLISIGESSCGVGVISEVSNLLSLSSHLFSLQSRRRVFLCAPRHPPVGIPSERRMAEL